MDLDRLVKILSCPPCRGEVVINGDSLRCRSCGKTYLVDDGTPVMLPEGMPHRPPPGHQESHNPYVMVPRDVIQEHRDGLVLDHGAGHQKQKYPHVIQLEMFRYPTTDVVGLAESLPFKDDTFHGVYSSAVLEHVTEPHKVAREIYRVTRPGGSVLIRTGFMVPFHAYPNHYFNSTVEGLRYLTRDFELELVGADPTAHHMLGWVLSVFFDGMEPEAKEEALGMTFGEVISRMHRGEYGPFARVSTNTHAALSPSVFFYGHKR